MTIYDFGPGTPGCEDCWGGRCTMNCSGRAGNRVLPPADDFAPPDGVTDFVDHLIERVKATPYQHLDGYMERYWLLNPYESMHGLPRLDGVPISMRLHHILRADRERHLHSHPWVAASLILRGSYVETRLVEGEHVERRYEVGDTNVLDANTFHKIGWVSPGGVWTLFTMGPKVASWGFLVDGKVVPWREYAPC